MITEREIASFLKNFKEKMKIWDVLFRDDRGKNIKALVDLEIRPIERKNVLEKLEIKDFSEGPFKDKLFGSADMWIFGRKIRKHEVYIKITMATMNNPVICVSFHIAQYKMKYPFK